MPTLRAAIDARAARQGAAEFTRSTDRMARGARTVDRSITRTEGRMRSLKGTTLGLAGVIGGLFVGLTFAAGARNAISTMVDFEFTMAQVKGVAQATDTQFAALTATARKLGATTRFSATEAGEGLLFLSRAGFSAEESIASIGSTLDLAAAGAIELGSAADIASNVLAQFSLTAEQTTRVADVLVTTANSANTDVSQMAEAMKMAGPVAGALGRSLEETSAAIGALGNAGIQASLAGTNLRGVFAGLLGPTTKAKKAIEELGLDIRDLDPTTNSITDIFEKFEDANLSAAQAVEIFGRRNAAAALVLTQSTTTLRELTKANEEAEGAAKEMADLMNDTLLGAARNLRSAWEELTLQIGEAGVSGAIRSFLDNATGALRILGNMESSIDQITPAMRIMAATIKLTAGALGIIVGVKFAGLVAGLGQATLAMLGFSFAADMSARSVLIIGAASAGLGAAVAALVEGNETLNTVSVKTLEVVQTLGAAIGMIFSSIGKDAEKQQEIWTAFEGRLEEISNNTKLSMMQVREEAEKNAEGTETFFDTTSKYLREMRDQVSDLLDVFIGLDEFDPGGLVDELNNAINSMKPNLVDIQAQIDGVTEAENDAKKGMEAYGLTSDNAASVITAGFSDAIFQAETFNDVLQNVIQSLAQMAFRAAAMSFFSSAFGGLFGASTAAAGAPAVGAGIGAPGGAPSFGGPLAFSAKGNVFASGPRIVPMAKGGIVSGPSVLPFAGEAGPEAVMPLSRDGRGRLGVTGGVSVNMNVYTNDAGSFRKSQRQITTSVGRGIRNAMR